MNLDIKILGWLQGMVLGLILATPLLSPSVMPWGVAILFSLSAFQLRMTDRRWNLRPGLSGWLSHIRMAPARMLPWAAITVVAFIIHSDGPAAPGAILPAALLCELLIYPMITVTIGHWQRRGSAAAVTIAIAACGLAPAGIAQNIAYFLLGVAGCMFWQRGPDGDLCTALAMLGSGLSATILAITMPASLTVAFPLALISFTVAFAQSTAVRRRPLPWMREHGGNARSLFPLRPGSRPF